MMPAVLGANIAFAKTDLAGYWTRYAPDLKQFWPRGEWTLPTNA